MLNPEISLIAFAIGFDKYDTGLLSRRFIKMFRVLVSIFYQHFRDVLGRDLCWHTSVHPLRVGYLIYKYPHSSDGAETVTTHKKICRFGFLIFYGLTAGEYESSECV